MVQKLYRLVIADDEFEIRIGLSSYIPWGELCFEVVFCGENGQEVLDFIELNEVDIVLCDINMPILSGIDLAKIFADKKIDIPLVFISGHQDFQYAQKAIQYGVKKYLLKPIKYDELFETFSEIKLLLDQQEKKSMPTTPIYSGDRVISLIEKYVYENYATVTLNSAAASIPLNSFYMSKYFKEKTGINFSDFVVKVKMERAKELLENVEYKVYEISELVGYSNPKNFTRAFRKFYGTTPKDFQNSGTLH